MEKVQVVIAGAGPAGIFTALELVKHNPAISIMLLDKGREISARQCPARRLGKCIGCNPCAIVNGWAGAGAFSDGKLSLSQEVGGHITEYLGWQKAQELIEYADSIYLQFGASTKIHGLDSQKVEQLTYEAGKHDIQLVACPVRHLGTDKVFDVMGGMFTHLCQYPNVTFHPLASAENIIVENGRAVGLIYIKDGKRNEVRADAVVLSPGRGGAEWLHGEANRLGLQTENNEVDIGVRVEVPNSVMDHLTQHLYEAKMIYYSDTYENRVRTFCMNPGGVVSEEHYEGGIAVVNGHSYQEAELKTQNTNFAILVSTRFTQPFNQPIQYGKSIAQLGNMLTGGHVMVQRLGDLTRGRRTDEDRLRKSTVVPTLTSAIPGDLSFALPSRHLTAIIEAMRAFDKMAPGLYSRNTLLYGVEVKFYSSKLHVNEHFETPIEKLYAIGDGAGITRGLMQASVTGIVVARDYLEKC